ncbi:MAG: nucleoside deaminase [Candidatus Saganbacteria bacterium]|nr:nucleoside deaminase [Candidatus Saganbacteria bacterium]
MQEKFIKATIKEAQKAAKKLEVPVGAVAVRNNKIIARAHNTRETSLDPTAHAEILCIRKAAKKIGRWQLFDITLYISLKPCPMCKQAIKQARIKKVIVAPAKYGKILSTFFKQLRKSK